MPEGFYAICVFKAVWGLQFFKAGGYMRGYLKGGESMESILMVSEKVSAVHKRPFYDSINLNPDEKGNIKDKKGGE